VRSGRFAERSSTDLLLTSSKYESSPHVCQFVRPTDPKEPSEVAEPDEFTPEGYNEYIGPQLDGRMQGRITKRAKDNDGNPIGRRHDSYLLDTRRYKVE
jgi:hypothetical protein